MSLRSGPISEPRRYPGTFIVIEGIDGCGSTTHSKRLAKALRADGVDARLTCEPTAGPIGGLIRQVLQKRLFVPDSSGPRAFAWSTMALLFAADRLDHLDSMIVPALRDGATVISDRYDLSTLAYQSVTAPAGERVIPWLREVNACALRPDLTVVIDVAAETSSCTYRGRGRSRKWAHGSWNAFEAPT
jgi:dTMP kinase